MKYLVTNIDKTTQRLFENGQSVFISPGETAILTNPPKESYIFHVEELLEEAEQMNSLNEETETKLTREEKNDRSME